MLIHFQLCKITFHKWSKSIQWFKTTKEFNLKLSKDVLDVSETALGNFKVLYKCSAFEDWLRSLVEEVHEGKEISYLLDINHLLLTSIKSTLSLHHSYTHQP